MKDRVLITGGTGLVGHGIRAACSHLDFNSNSDYEFIFISSKDYDLTNADDVQRMYEEVRPNKIIHLAACVGGLFKNMSQKVDMLEKNLIMNFNIVRGAHDFGVKRLIACLSTCVFPHHIPSYPVNEEMLHEGPPHHSNDAYAYAKRILEVHCRAYRESCGDDFICVSPTNIYGPHDNFDIEEGHVLPSLIHKCRLANIGRKPFVIRGTGTPLRQFIYSQDVGELILRLLDLETCPPHVILSVPESHEVSIREAAELIAREMKYENGLTLNESYSDGQHKKTVSSSRIESLFPDFVFTPLEEGLRETIRWFDEHYHDEARIGILPEETAGNPTDDLVSPGSHSNFSRPPLQNLWKRLIAWFSGGK
jgi:GDP-L-fucose synthase